MLVLSRKTGERVCIGGSVEVTVLESRNGRVKLGFSGPTDVPIHRAELLCAVGAQTECCFHGRPK